MVRDYYFDTSALLKGYITEDGSAWVRDILAEATSFVFTSDMTRVEAACAFARREREGAFSSLEHAKLWRAFEHDMRYKLYRLRVNRQTLAAASRFGRTHPLRAYDALQLASAWLMNKRLDREGKRPLVFVGADRRLQEIAAQIGLATQNPLDYRSAVS